MIRRLLVHRFAHRMIVSGTGAFAARGGRGGYPRNDWDVEGTASEVGDEPRRLP